MISKKVKVSTAIKAFGVNKISIEQNYSLAIKRNYLIFVTVPRCFLLSPT